MLKLPLVVISGHRYCHPETCQCEWDYLVHDADGKDANIYSDCVYQVDAFVNKLNKNKSEFIEELRFAKFFI